MMTTDDNGKGLEFGKQKQAPKVSEEDIDRALIMNMIYAKVRARVDHCKHAIQVQRGQIGYGLEKYPETLNDDTWSVVETIGHIFEEHIDSLHYLQMLQHKLNELDRSIDLYSRDLVENMIDDHMGQIESLEILMKIFKGDDK